MGRPVYLIAKYVPDVFRNEPKNVGVVVWCDGVSASRFLGETKDGKIDGRTVGEDIRPYLSSYKQWVEAWRKMLAKDALRDFRSHKIIERADSAFLDAIQSTGEGNYILERGGELLEDVPSRDIWKVTDYLFNRLVSMPEEDKEGVSAVEKREELLKDARVAADSRVFRNKRITIELNDGTKTHTEFHFAIGNGQVDFLAQIVPLTSRTKAVKTIADAVSFRFSNLNSPQVKKGAKKMVFIFSPDDTSDEYIEDSLVQLQSVATVVDLNKDESRAVEIIRETVLNTKPHE